jgi:hypothetical protein
MNNASKVVKAAQTECGRYLAEPDPFDPFSTHRGRDKKFQATLMCMVSFFFLDFLEKTGYQKEERWGIWHHLFTHPGLIPSLGNRQLFAQAWHLFSQWKGSVSALWICSPQCSLSYALGNIGVYCNLLILHGFCMGYPKTKAEEPGGLFQFDCASMQNSA